jgi:hypothetical protein
MKIPYFYIDYEDRKESLIKKLILPFIFQVLKVYCMLWEEKIKVWRIRFQSHKWGTSPAPYAWLYIPKIQILQNIRKISLNVFSVSGSRTCFVHSPKTFQVNNVEIIYDSSLWNWERKTDKGIRRKRERGWEIEIELWVSSIFGLKGERISTELSPPVA